MFVIVFILLDVIYSLRDISYWGMIPAISSDSHERSTYTALGAFTGSIGYNGVTVIVVPVVSWFTWKFTGQWEQGRTGWAAFAIIIAVLGLLTAWSVAFGTRKPFELSEDGFHWLGDYEITADEVLGGIAPKANKLEKL